MIQNTRQLSAQSSSRLKSKENKSISVVNVNSQRPVVVAVIVIEGTGFLLAHVTKKKRNRVETNLKYSNIGSVTNQCHIQGDGDDGNDPYSWLKYLYRLQLLTTYLKINRTKTKM